MTEEVIKRVAFAYLAIGACAEAASLLGASM